LMVSSTSGSVRLYIRLYIPPSEALCSLLFELLLLLLLLPLLLLLDFLPLPLEEDARRGVVVVVGLVLPSLSLSCCGAKLFCCSCCSDNTFSFSFLLLKERSSSVVLNKTFGNANRMRLNKNKPSVIKVSLDSPPSNAAFRRPRGWCWCCFGEKSLPLIVVISFFSLRRRVSMLVVCVCVLILYEAVLK
jgi:hypothetical protein